MRRAGSSRAQSTTTSVINEATATHTHTAYTWKPTERRACGSRTTSANPSAKATVAAVA